MEDSIHKMFLMKFSALQRMTKISQADIAEAVGVSEGTVNHWLKGTPPRITDVERVIKFFASKGYFATVQEWFQPGQIPGFDSKGLHKDLATEGVPAVATPPAAYPAEIPPALQDKLTTDRQQIIDLKNKLDTLTKRIERTEHECPYHRRPKALAEPISAEIVTIAQTIASAVVDAAEIARANRKKKGP